MTTSHRDYSHRDVLDKLGLKRGQRLMLDDASWPLPPELRQRILERADGLAEGVEPLDVVVLTVGPTSDVTGALEAWRARISPTGAIWVLTPKRGHPGYVNQTDLIPAGAAARVVDNKTCSVDDSISAMRFVIRTRDRPR